MENVTVTPHFKGEPFDKMLRQELKRTKLNNKRREAKEHYRRKIASNRGGVR